MELQKWKEEIRTSKALEQGAEAEKALQSGNLDCLKDFENVIFGRNGE